MAINNEADDALKAFEKAYQDYEEAYKAALVTNGTKAFIEGDLKAQKALNLKLKFNLVNKEALKYIKEYKKELAAGGSTIQGKFIPWLENKSKEERSAISKILEEGYKAGKATGVREFKKGMGYPKNSIAADLQQYFNSRKSHAALVARTEIARIQSHGSINRYHKQGVSKIMWLVFNPCPVCEQYARRVYDIDKMPREIPAHPQCRCCAAPVPDDVPTGPAPNQKIPEVFEKEAKALPPRYASPEDLRKQILNIKEASELKNNEMWEQISNLRHEITQDQMRYGSLMGRLDNPAQWYKTEAELRKAKEFFYDFEAKLLEKEDLLNNLKLAKSQITKEATRQARELLFINDGAPRAGLYSAPEEYLQYGRVIKPETLKKMEEAQDFINKVTSEKVRGIMPDLRVWEINERSWTNKTHNIYLDENADTAVLLHETGHNIENTNAAFRKATQDYLARRTEGEEAKTMNELVGSTRYKNSEIAKKDNFITPYIGKIYDDKETEVLSMGLQYLYEEPAMLAEKDPELFDLILNGLRGAY